MSQPQATEDWSPREPEVQGGFGVSMTQEQFDVVLKHISKATEETSRREAAVAQSLEDLKRVEVVRTYAQFVKDITTSIQTLSMMPDTEDTRSELLKTLSNATSAFSAGGALSIHEDKKELETKKALYLQTDSGTTESPENSSV